VAQTAGVQRVQGFRVQLINHDWHTLDPASSERPTGHTLHPTGGVLLGSGVPVEGFSLCCVGVVELVLGCRLWVCTVGCALWHKVQVFTGFGVAGWYLSIITDTPPTPHFGNA
jgi:hypothetical protein